MTPEQFCYWMQGFVELSGGNPPTTDQWTSISEHLQQVFNKKTPPVQLTRNIEDAIRQATPFAPPDPLQPYRWPIDIKPTDIIC